MKHHSLTKICSLWRTRKELLFIAALIILVLHYAFLNDSLNFGGTKRILNDFPLARRPILVTNNACEVPKLDPLAGDMAKHERLPVAIICDGEDWVRCYQSKCNQTEEIQEKISSITCEFRDLFPFNNTNYTLGPAKQIGNNETYYLIKSDYVKVSCSGINITDGKTAGWSGVSMALRTTPVPPVVTAQSDAINVFILVFDTVSANGFQRLMPESWKALKEDLRATMLRGNHGVDFIFNKNGIPSKLVKILYSTIGDGTASALLTILTGKSELELMDAKKDNGLSMESLQFLYRKLKERGFFIEFRDGAIVLARGSPEVQVAHEMNSRYRTGFFEDISASGTVLNRLGFRGPPADHHFYKSILEHDGDRRYCVGGTPEYKLILNITEQFMNLDGSRFGLTFVADLTASDFNMVQSADEVTAALLLAYRRHRKDSLLVVMSDHGPRNKRVRDSWQGKVEERLPLLAIALPTKLLRTRPRAAAVLSENSGVITTPFDVHATLLDVLRMEDEDGGTRGRSLLELEPIPKNRTCSDVGVEPHWCVCLSWEQVAPTDPMFQRTAEELVRYINSLLTEVSHKCAPRNLTSIAWVLRHIAPSGGMSAFNPQGSRSEENTANYQIKVILQPDKATYEATMLHIQNEDRFVIKERHISKTNLGAYEALCIAGTHPHLRPFCHCKHYVPSVFAV